MKFLEIYIISNLLYQLCFSFRISKFSHKTNPIEEFKLHQRFFKDNLKINDENIELKNFGAIILKNNEYFLTNKETEVTTDNVVAKAYFTKSMLEKGWDKISISTFKNADSFVQVYYAAYLEARLSADDIFNFYYNIKENSKEKETFQEMKRFLDKVGTLMENRFENLNTIKEEDTQFWTQIFLGFIQLKGLQNGYKYHITKHNLSQNALSLGEFLIIQADGEVPELLRYFNYKNKSPFARMNMRLGAPNYFKEAFNIDTKDPKVFWSHLMWHSKCSAMIKLVKDENGKITDVLSGHTTWTDYTEMLRTYKHYNFYLSGPNHKYLPSSEITFSSYPGCLSSTDDFYLTNNNLMITETTLEVIDIRQYDYVKKEEDYIPNFLRVMAATRLSKTAGEWVQILKKYNSGTYSSQWMIVDYNIVNQIKGTDNKPDNLIYVVEQTPNRIISYDISQQFYNQGYFASFNRAFFEETRMDMNQALVIALYGDIFGYNGANRRKIFNKLQSKVKDLKTLKDVLRYNGYNMYNQEFPDDPSRTNPGSGISARYELGGDQYLSGGIDCKVTNSNMAKKLEAYAISGPTYDNNPYLTPFSWNNYGHLGLSHRGSAETYNFPWILTSPQTLCCSNSDVHAWN